MSLLTIYTKFFTLLKTLVNEFQIKGKYNVTFNAGSLTSGVYIYKINAGNFTDTKKLVLIKYKFIILLV
ncbi:MAG: hypothetical protein COW08_07110 [Ignavibacteriales bacterium CG12_big_fil_rev_8_21_14_0_65_30_8]|nr:MAG: hypothetical protein COW08_07110 [Ignavibacteriales bacterium CG12_big_fil_rev_8_21_14_0_65_30_8]